MKRNMKRLSGWMLALTMMAGLLAGCGGGDPKPTDTPKPAPTQAAKPTKPTKPPVKPEKKESLWMEGKTFYGATNPKEVTFEKGGVASIFDPSDGSTVKAKYTWDSKTGKGTLSAEGETVTLSFMANRFEVLDENGYNIGTLQDTVQDVDDDLLDDTTWYFEENDLEVTFRPDGTAEILASVSGDYEEGSFEWFGAGACGTLTFSEGTIDLTYVDEESIICTDSNGYFGMLHDFPTFVADVPDIDPEPDPEPNYDDSSWITGQTWYYGETSLDFTDPYMVEIYDPYTGSTEFYDYKWANSDACGHIELDGFNLFLNYVDDDTMELFIDGSSKGFLTSYPQEQDNTDYSNDLAYTTWYYGQIEVRFEDEFYVNFYDPDTGEVLKYGTYEWYDNSDSGSITVTSTADMVRVDYQTIEIFDADGSQGYLTTTPQAGW